MLAYNYRRQGRYQQAREIDSVVLNQRRERYGTEHTSTAKSLNNMALDLKGLGMTEAALYLEQQALTILIRVDGEDAPSTLTSVHNLANSYARVQRHRNAADLHSKVVGARIRVLGEGHAETIAPMDLLGVDHRNLSDTDAGLLLLELDNEEQRGHVASEYALHALEDACLSIDNLSSLGLPPRLPRDNACQRLSFLLVARRILDKADLPSTPMPQRESPRSCHHSCSYEKRTSAKVPGLPATAFPPLGDSSSSRS